MIHDYFIVLIGLATYYSIVCHGYAVIIQKPIKSQPARLISMQDKASKEFIIPQTNPQSYCTACLYGNVLLKPCGHRNIWQHWLIFYKILTKIIFIFFIKKMCESCVKDLHNDTVKSSFRNSECVHCGKVILYLLNLNTV